MGNCETNIPTQTLLQPDVYEACCIFRFSRLAFIFDLCRDINGNATHKAALRSLQRYHNSFHYSGKTERVIFNRYEYT